jgi:hypothetical protein
VHACSYSESIAVAIEVLVQPSKKVVGGAAKTRRPGDGHGHETDGRTVILVDDGVDDLVSVSDGLRRVVGVEVGASASTRRSRNELQDRIRAASRSIAAPRV